MASFAVLVVDERNPQAAPLAEVTTDAIGDYLTTQLAAKIAAKVATAGWTNVVVLNTDVEYSKARNAIRHYYLVQHD